MDDLLGKKEKKKHRVSKSGVKADKKKENKKKKLGLSNERHNPRAFSVSNIVRTKRNMQRNLDRAQSKEVVPMVNRAEELPPPTLVAVMGPKGVGKSTLIRSLVKIFTNQNLSDTKGPITCITGRKRRVTFFECPLDIYSLTDMSKVADLVLLMIDASYGFEMETFEYLNMLQLHGFPKVVGVLTHLDSFRANKTLQATKKALKHRFWTEIYKGAKMFDLSGVVNGKYLKHEVKRLSLYLMRVKYRPLTWRNTHPYVLVDRVDDITPVSRSAENPNSDRDVCVYGYVRGTHLKESMRMHLIGAGDFNMTSVNSLPDPCPMPNSGETAGKASLKKKQSLLYAPMANVGRVQISDRDGVYIDLKNVHYTKQEHLQLGDRSSDTYDASALTNGNTPAALLRSMQDVKEGVDVMMNEAELSLFKDSKAVKSYEVPMDEDEADDDDYAEDFEGNDDDVEDEDDVDEDDEDDEMDEYESLDGDEDYDNEDADDNEHNSELDDEEHDERIVAKSASSRQSGHSSFSNHADNQNESWRDDMKSKAVAAYRKRSAENAASDLQQLVYGNDWRRSGSNRSKSDDDLITPDVDDDDEDELFVVKGNSVQQRKYLEANRVDSHRFGVADKQLASERLLLWQDAYESLCGSFSVSSFEKLRISNGSSSSTRPLISCPDELRSSLLHIKNKFVTGDWGGVTKPGQPKKAKATKPTDNSQDENSDEGSIEGLDDDEVYGDFEDLQTGQVFGKGSSSTLAPKKKKSHSVESVNFDEEDFDDDDDDDEVDDDDEDQDIDGDSGDDEGDQLEEDGEDDDEEDSDDEEAANDRIDAELRAAAAKSKSMFKANFDMKYDNKELEDEGDSATKKKKKKGDDEDEEDEKLLEIAKKLQEDRRERNKAEFGDDGELVRQRHEGCRQGLYVRIVITGVPVEFTRNFSPHLPVILGGLQPFETELGFVNARVKRHRWHKGILKSNDPLIFSIGWRRFQSIPIYTIEDQNSRERYLKYTPEHMHCMCSFYGPVVPPNSGVLAFQKPSSTVANFRLSLTGTTLELKSTPSVQKKLKLVGMPRKIFKNTAFISGMFGSALEVARFEGAKLKTVSGIRGQIKKAVREGDPGTFRATFEDKILMSDIITCRLWVPVEVKKFYNPVMSLLESSNPEDWKGMRTTSELRKALKVPIPVQKDSLYKPVVRVRREFKKTIIPKKLEEGLPFASKPKLNPKHKPGTYMGSRAVILEPGDRKKRALLQMLTTVGKDKSTKRAETKAVKSKQNLAKKLREKEKFEPLHKEERKRKFAMEGREKAIRESKGKKRRGGGDLDD